METKIIKTQKVLSPTQISLAEYAINTYRGCEFDCVYCYSRENKNTRDKQHLLCVKENAADILKKELKYHVPKSVVLGTTTECFQYKEKEFRITEAILKILNSQNISCTILTKSPLVTEFIPLIAQNPQNKIYFTFNIHEDRLRKMIEPSAPQLALRVKAIEKLLKSGIPTRIHAGPFIPGICSLGGLMEMIPKGISEIDIELYHKKQGNFSRLLDVIENAFGRRKRDELSEIYSSQNSYKEFSKVLKDRLSQYKNSHGFKIYYIEPGFDSYYNGEINYNNALF